MNLLKRWLGKRDRSPTGKSFWEWFLHHERSFFETMKKREPALINIHFLKKIMPQLHRLNKAFYCEAGMCDEKTAELVITAEGDIKSFVFVEELVAMAPVLKSWKFTALKPATGASGMKVSMNGEDFDSGNIGFFFDENDRYPDEINLTLVHSSFTPENNRTIIQGCFLYLDCVLGELNAVTLIDHIEIKGPSPRNNELIPMEKLNDFLVWKEKEFVEKYDGVRHDTENDTYSVFEGEDADGFLTIGIINTELLEWSAKASHPWMLVIEIDFRNTRDAHNGLPGDRISEVMHRFEEQLSAQLVDSAGYLNLGRRSGAGKRHIYLACKEFRLASKTVSRLIAEYEKDLVCSYDIYKDKYWRTMDRFRDDKID